MEDSKDNSNVLRYFIDISTENVKRNSEIAGYSIGLTLLQDAKSYV